VRIADLDRELLVNPSELLHHLRANRVAPQALHDVAPAGLIVPHLSQTACLRFGFTLDPAKVASGALVSAETEAPVEPGTSHDLWVLDLVSRGVP
jgi:hypothetical protein